LYYLDLSTTQITKFADDALRDFDEERLKFPKQLDAFDFTEIHLGLTAEPQRLTPNLSIYGLMAFNDGHWWVWPNEDEQESGIEMPRKHDINKGTFLIDDRIADPTANVGWRNFSVLHEGFHWIIHPKVFSRQEVVYQRHCDKRNMRLYKRKSSMTGIEVTEWQANVATAYFLMPPDAVKFGFCEVFKIERNRMLPVQYSPLDECNLEKLADLFSASKKAVSIRLEELGLMSGFPDNRW
jgi:hypothetical protein